MKQPELFTSLEAADTERNCDYGSCGEPAVTDVPCFDQYGRHAETRAACERHAGYWGLHVGYDYRRPIRPETGVDGLTVIQCDRCGREFFEYKIVLLTDGRMAYSIADHECKRQTATYRCNSCGQQFEASDHTLQQFEAGELRAAMCESCLDRAAETQLGML